MGLDIPQDYYNKSYSDSIADGFSLFGKTYVKIVPIYIICSVIFLIISSLVMTAFNWQVEVMSNQILEIINEADYYNMTEQEMFELMNMIMSYLGLSLLNSIPNSFFNYFPSFLALGIVSGYLYKRYLQEDVDFGGELSKSFKVELILIPALFAILLALGLVLLIPWLFMYIYWVFSPSMHTIESEKGLKCFKASFKYSKGNFWRIMGILLINGILTGIISFIYNLILDFVIPTATYNAAFAPETRNYFMIIVYTLLYNLVNMLLSPLLSCLLITFLVFSKKQLIRRYDPSRFYREEDAALQGYGVSTPYEAPTQEETLPNIKPPVAISREPEYCPFCGFAMDKSKSFRFCPSCGGKIPRA